MYPLPAQHQLKPLRMFEVIYNRRQNMPVNVTIETVTSFMNKSASQRKFAVNSTLYIKLFSCFLIKRYHLKRSEVFSNIVNCVSGRATKVDQ
ncbi:hypothetical protein FKM82_009746 [Ascaphus truei]